MNDPGWVEGALTSGRTGFRPGEILESQASWSLSAMPERVEARLLWYTQGKGSQDVAVVARFPFEAPQAADRREFRLTLPSGPYSFSGQLISLSWAIEVVAEPGETSGRAELVLAPHGEEVQI